MSGDDPKVSIYITTCNRLSKLQRAIDSVLKQTYKNIELIICDDASSDGTQNFIESLMLTDGRVKYIRNVSNAGACATRNLGIFSASGHFITGLDDDDEFTTDRIRTFVDSWKDEYAFCCANFIEKFADGNEKDYYLADGVIRYFDHKDLLFENPASNQIFTLTQRLKKIGGFDIRAKRLQDWDTWLRLSYQFGPFQRLPNSTYIMHHDHLGNEPRVSKSYSFANALRDLQERNNDLYSEENKDFMEYVVSLAESKASFKKTLKWALKNRAPGYFIKYFSQTIHTLREKTQS